MASEICEGLPENSSEENSNIEKAPRPPNRKKHEEQVADLSGKIKSLEDLRQKANDKLRTSRDAVAGFRDRRDRISTDKADLDDKLNVINKAVETKKDALQRLKTNFFVTSEEALDHQVKMLQQELHKNHFKANEERKLVAEIDKLNRSRKAIKEFKAIKEEMDKLKSSQKEIRDRRDQMFRERGELKRKEDEAKNDIRDLRDSLETMKVQIDSWIAEKRLVTSEFRIQETAYKKYISERREEAKLRRKEEKEAAEAQKIKEWEEIKANEEPFEKERALVATLIVYCQKLDPCLTESDGGSPPSPVDEANNLNGVKSCATAAEEVPKNCTIYRKNDEDDILFAGVKKNSNKKGAKKQKARNLKLNPETYLQFSSLALQPPSTSKDIPGLLEKLKLKKAYFEDLAEKEKAARLLNEPSPLIDYLSDELISSETSSTEDHRSSKKSNKKKDNRHQMNNGGANFNIDQFPSLPQPMASARSSMFASANGDCWEMK